MPELEKLQKLYQGRGVSFLALSLEPDEQVVFEAARQLNLQLPVAVARGEMLAPFGVNQVPSTVFIKNGVIVAAASGERKLSFLTRRVEALLEP